MHNLDVSRCRQSRARRFPTSLQGESYLAETSLHRRNPPKKEETHARVLGLCLRPSPCLPPTYLSSFVQLPSEVLNQLLELLRFPIRTACLSFSRFFHGFSEKSTEGRILERQNGKTCFVRCTDINEGLCLLLQIFLVFRAARRAVTLRMAPPLRLSLTSHPSSLSFRFPAASFST